MKRILIANRGEIAIRIARAARGLGLHTIGIFATDDDASLHTRYVDEAHALPREGVPAYLDQDEIIALAKATAADAIHPGYGFLSENSDFASRCESNGLTFIGPSPKTLRLFGDKLASRAIAQEIGLPVLPGTTAATTLEEVRQFAERVGKIMLKAIAGGGGRGMRLIQDLQEVDEAYARCSSEALKAFGSGDLYAEKFLPAARHIEVQILGDAYGNVCHLWERDCTIQRRHQKLIEIAPAPTLDPRLREKILGAATKLAEHVRYTSLGTFEFLVHDQEFWFMEANPRIQVEHPITEEITGVDLVKTQIRLASGETLANLGLLAPPSPTGFAVQARVNLEELLEDGTPAARAGCLSTYMPPSGPQVRVDGYGYAGYTTNPRYDSLLAKVITRGDTFEDALKSLDSALREFHISGVPNNIPLLLSIAQLPQLRSGDFDTGLVGENLSFLLEAASRQTSRTPPASIVERSPPTDSAEGPKIAIQEGDALLTAPMNGILMALQIAKGDSVTPGQALMVVEAMKMEHVIRSPLGGFVADLVVNPGDSVVEGAHLASVRPSAVDASNGLTQVSSVNESHCWSREVDEIVGRREIALGMGGVAKVARQRSEGKLNARERIDALVDQGSFREIGAMTAFGSYDGDAGTSLSAANFVTGTAMIDRRKVLIGVDDFTLRGGSGDAAIHDKQIFAERYAHQMRLPVVRLLDGASGGGSVKMALEHGFHYLPVNPGWDAVVDNLSIVPVVSAALGPAVGLAAARFVMSHFGVMVEGIGQVFTAGPPVVASTMRELLTKEELGGAAIHRGNGIVERIVATEADAFRTIRDFLSYLPDSVFALPPVRGNSDPCDRIADDLIRAIPRSVREPYLVQPILEAIFDVDSILPFAEYGGSTITALARLDGHPVGLIATDPMKGVTMSAEGAMAVTRLVDLCETFHLPIVSLTDQGGMAIGSVAERAGTIRYGARAIAAIYQARAPQAELILRRVFGVGGAGAVNRHRTNRSWAWPSGMWGSLPPQGGIEAAFRAELKQASDPQAVIARITNELERIGSPFLTAQHFGVQDLIDPRESRVLLCDWVKDAYRLLPELLGRPAFGTRP